MTAEGFRKLAGRFLSGRKTVTAALILGIFGVALIALSGLSADKPRETASAPAAAFSGEEYAHQLETRLEEMVAAITGETDPRVLVTLESGEEQVYGLDETRGEESTHVILKDADGSQQALTVTRLEPKIRGVIVVTAGGEDPRLRETLLQAVSTALHVSSARVFVTGSRTGP